jgi:L-aminopeptidase/D-esterase-like protein
VVTDTRLNKDPANHVATVPHGGLARAVRPAHTMHDGDTIFCLTTGEFDVPYDAVEVIAADLVARALALGVRAALQ